MTKPKCARRFSTLLAIGAILALAVVVIVLWLKFGEAGFKNKEHHLLDANATTTGDVDETIRLMRVMPTNHTRHKEIIEKSQLENLGTDSDEVFVKPLRINMTPPYNKSSDNLTLRHHNGHFRHKTADVWDRHPTYEIDAFGRKLFLELEHNDNFIDPNLHIVRHHTKENYTQELKHDHRISGCFYTGKVKDDNESKVSVSLCHGMTGYIHTSDSTYYIEPVEKFLDGSMGSLIHRIRRLSYPSKNDIPEYPEFLEHSENQTVIEDDFYMETVARPKDHTIRRRSVEQQPYSDADGMCEPVEERVWRRNGDQLTRSTREANLPGSMNMISNESFIKVILVADKSVVKYHSTEDDLMHYILTLMSHVSFLFKDVTIGNAITVELVGIRMLKNDDFSNEYSQDMLAKFCDWQNRTIVERTHDVSVLLTRDEICRNGTQPNNCTTLGVAQVNSMCQNGCAVVRDRGLATSYTIVHELGHILNAPHDEDPKCLNLNRGLKVPHIMSKAMKGDAKPFTWSPCTKYFVTEFIESSRSGCMKHPSRNKISTYFYTDMLPGDKFSLDKQCELEFGPGVMYCPSLSVCEHLWCTENNNICHSTFSPWADGTVCGRNRVCFNGVCRPEQDFTPIDGGWGPWMDWGECSRTCGGGIRMSIRYCNSPKPVNGGSYCIGESKRFESCNTMDCDPLSKDFRAVQCSEFDGNAKDFPEIGHNVQWVPDYNLVLPEEQCKLYCIPNPIQFMKRYPLKKKVIDGTKCGPTGFGICINGKCEAGGCDNKLDSSMFLDDCGICGGDNSKCQEITGSYNIPAESAGYSYVITIPKGSSNLNITQDSYPVVDENYLVLVDNETGVQLLNGNNLVKVDGKDVNFSGVQIQYSGSGIPVEWISSPKNKKLPKDLVVQVLSVGNRTLPNIRWRYVIDIENAPSYSWQLYNDVPWTKCNSICDGKEYRRAVCVDLLTGLEVARSYCDSMPDSLSQTRECNAHCELSWIVDSKSACSPQCGKGIRQVYYKCVKVYRKKISRKLVNEKHCIVLAQPPRYESCNTICNSTRWNYSPWSKCSKTCGGGIQRRTAKCVDSYGPIDDSYCNNSEMITEQICNTEGCPVWALADSSSCSHPCEDGQRNITYYCVLGGRIVPEHACDINTKPPLSEPCNRDVPCGRWKVVPQYDPCSVTCGEGIERRKYTCQEKYGSRELGTEFCWQSLRPSDESRLCYRGECNINSFENRPRIQDVFDNSIVAAPFHRYNTFRWVLGSWTQCSKTCGGGRSLQMFHCRDLSNVENEMMCNPGLRPNIVKECNDVPCPKWEVGDWSPVCDANCERHRQVRCVDSLGVIHDDLQCDKSQKPINGTKCKLLECPQITNTIPRRYFDSKETEDKRYRWKVGPWKVCSNSCGKGTRRRQIECEDTLNDITVVDSLCRNLRKPKITKTCEKYTCKYVWVEGYWSDCSATCGTGIKKRNVTCHRVHRGGIIDPLPLPDLYQNKISSKDYCSVYNRPPSVAKCLLSHCGDQYVWQPDPWKGCTQKCGKKGRQVRVLNCINMTSKEKVPRHLCPRNLKPPRKRKCNQWRCLYKSCREIKHYTQTKENKDYIISLRNRPVQIYCYKMDTPVPQEYISLHPDTNNYAEIYDRRLMNITSCPYNGQRRDNCECDQVGPQRSGFTKFWKVRINIGTMQIIGDDFTFSKQLKGIQIPYGTAGDCYSSVEGCAQGRFSVDLSHTSFKLSPAVRWEKLGSFASMFIIHRKETMASGKCGGYCGNCMPDPGIGLAVQIT